MLNLQRILGFGNSQRIENNNIIVDEKYLRSLLSFQNNPSDVNAVVLALFDIINEIESVTNKITLPPEIENKISHNNVVLYRDLIDANYSENGFFLDSAYEALDTVTPGRKRNFLKFINYQYLLTLGEYQIKNDGMSKMEVIRANSDNILTEVINKLLVKISVNNSAVEHISSESIEYNVITIVCHAFVDCKILENPNQQ